MCSELDVMKFWCWNDECPDHGKKGKGNIVLKERYGKLQNALLKCRTCGHCFSETRSTVFFRLKTPREEILRTMALIPEMGASEVSKEQQVTTRTGSVNGRISVVNIVRR